MSTFNFGKGQVPAQRHKNPDGTDGGWVAATAKVDPTATIGTNALVSEQAIVSGHAQIIGCARVFGNAIVKDQAHVGGQTIIYGNAIIQNHARVSDTAQVGGNAIISDNAWVTACSCVSGDTLVGGSRILKGVALHGKASIGDDGDKYDFCDGAGFVPAHQHKNQTTPHFPGGWVADTAVVAPDASIDTTSTVSGKSKIPSGISIFSSNIDCEINVPEHGTCKIQWCKISGTPFTPELREYTNLTIVDNKIILGNYKLTQAQYQNTGVYSINCYTQKEDGTLYIKNSIGLLHHPTLPAIIETDGTTKYYWHGVLHSYSGSAIQGPNTKRWFLHGREFTENEIAILMAIGHYIKIDGCDRQYEMVDGFFRQTIGEPIILLSEISGIKEPRHIHTAFMLHKECGIPLEQLISIIKNHTVQEASDILEFLNFHKVNNHIPVGPKSFISELLNQPAESELINSVLSLFTSQIVEKVTSQVINEVLA